MGPAVERRRFDEEGQRRLVEVATRHFAEHGYEGASLNEIIAEAGLSKGSFYHHFADKAALFAAALSAVTTELHAAAPVPETPRTRAAYWRAMEEHGEHMLRALQTRPVLVAFLASLRQSPARDPAFAAIRARGRAVYLPFLQAGRDLGCVRADLSLELLADIWDAADGALDREILASDEPITAARIEAHARIAFDMFRRIFEARPSKSRPPRWRDGRR